MSDEVTNFNKKGSDEENVNRYHWCIELGREKERHIKVLFG